jgi:hypothetical protein
MSDGTSQGEFGTVAGGPPGSPIPGQSKAGTTGFTRGEWRRRVLEELGGDGVDAELSNSQIDAALNRALEHWNRYRPCLMWFPFDIAASETVVISFFADAEHTLPANSSYIRRVIRVEFSDADRRILGPRAGFLEGYYLRWGFEGPRLFFQLHMAQRRYERLTGSRPAWYWNPADRNLYISSPGRDTRAMVLASRENKLEDIPYDHVSLFLKGAVARAKYYLARTLGSKGNPKGPGGEIVTDAPELRSESREEWREFDEELKVSMLAHPPPGYIG